MIYFSRDGLCNFFFEMPHFSHFQNQIGKMEHSEKNEHKKEGHFDKNVRDQF